MDNINNLDTLIKALAKYVSPTFKTSDSFDVKSNKLYSFMQNLDLTFGNAVNVGDSVDIKELAPLPNVRFTVEAETTETPYVLTEVLLRCSLNKNPDKHCVNIYKKLGILLGNILKNPNNIKDPQCLLQWNILGTIASELKAKQILEKSLMRLNDSMKVNQQLIESNLFNKK